MNTNKLSTDVVTATTVIAIKVAKSLRKKARVRSRGSTIKRQRKSVLDVYNELGRSLFRRAFRMSIETFFKLYDILKQDIENCVNHSSEGNKGPNGKIHSSVRLACALRIFAGSDPMDLITTFGIAKADVHKSLDIIIAAVLNCKKLGIKFPTDHDKQREIAAGFLSKSRAGFSNCVGALDGMLIWILKPTTKQCEKVGVGSKKFFCGRKKKFGLNLQAICDSEKRFTYVSINYPGSTSDFLAFESSSIRLLLEQNDFLAPSLCIFGDNAYVNRSYMATPYPNVGSGSKDSYNFYHSQLRINIECAFGILVQRWGILRTPLSSCNLVLTVCSVHNFLIDCRLEQNGIIPNTVRDTFHLTVNGAIELESRYNNAANEVVVIPTEVLGAGDHYEDDPMRSRRNNINSSLLPREILHRIIAEGNYTRPAITNNR